MGLSLVSGIVQRAGGSLDIQTAPGRGTAVILTLPVARPGPRPGAMVSIAEPRARSFSAAVLRALGFDVAAGAAAADDAAPPSGLIWVADDSAPAAAIESFLAGDPRRRVIVFGARPTGMDDPRLTAAGSPLQPAEAREVLGRAAREATRNS